MSSTPLEIATRFFALWSSNDIDEAIEMLSSDVLYDNVPFPDITGRDNVRRFQAEFGIGSEFVVDWRIVNIAAAGNVVLNERIDIFRHRSGGLISIPVMGTITVEGSAITVWRDYFDPGDFQRQLELIRR
jgi:limonene-1,2-epoxide hydrolase